MNYTESDILKSCKIGFEFEFISKEDPVLVARSISDALGIKVVVAFNVDNIEHDEIKYHTPIVVTGNLFKLEPDWSGGKDCKELVTGPLPFEESMIVLLKVLKWIDANAMTTDRTAIQFNVSFDEWKIKTRNKLQHLNILKFCLAFNEAKAMEAFPKRKNSIYAKSIKTLVTNNIFNISSVGSNCQFTVAPTKYYAVNFLKIPMNYLEFRFLGGEDYQKKKQGIIDSIEYSIVSLFRNLQFNDLTDNEVGKLNKILNDNKRYLDAYKHPALFNELFPNIKLTIDNRNDIEVIKTFWNSIHDKLFEVLLRSGCDDMSVNYDSDVSVIQIKDAKFNTAEISGVELIGCSGNGLFTYCKFYNCKMNNIHMEFCDVVKDCVMSQAKVLDTSVGVGNVLDDCYIANEKGPVINAKIEGGVLRKGTVGAKAEISDGTSVVTKTDEEPKKYKGTFGTYKTPDKSSFKNAKYVQSVKGGKKK